MQSQRRQTQPSTGVLRKRCSENIQQIYRKQPCRSLISIRMLCNFIEITLRHRLSPVNLQHIFRTPFLRTPLEGFFRKTAVLSCLEAAISHDSLIALRCFGKTLGKISTRALGLVSCRLTIQNSCFTLKMTPGRMFSCSPERFQNKYIVYFRAKYCVQSFL